MAPPKTSEQNANRNRKGAILRPDTAALVIGRIRPMLFIAVRLQLAVFNLVSDAGWTNDEPLRVGATLALAAIDVVTFTVIRRSGRALLPFRVPFDLTVAFAWSAMAAPDLPYTGVVYLLFPLVAEFVVTRRWWNSLAFCAAGIAAVLSGRALAHADFFVADVLSSFALMTVAGTVFVVSFAGVKRRLRARFDREHEAFEALVRLQAVNDLRIGAGGQAGEAMLRAWFLLSQVIGEAAARQRAALDARRTALAETTRQQARYLREVLLVYSAEQRRGRARVADHLHLEIGRDDGSVVLAPRQAAALTRQLDELDLSGQYTVRVDRSDRATGALTAYIGDRLIEVPPDYGGAFQFVPLAFFVAVGPFLSMSAPAYGAVPWWAAVVGALALLAVGRLSYRAERRWSTESGNLTSASAAVILAAGVWAAQFSERWVISDGRRLLPALGPFTGAMLVMGTAWPRLTIRARFGWVSLLYAVFAGSALLNPHGLPTWRFLLGELVFPTTTLVTTIVFVTINQSVGRRLHEGWIMELTERTAVLYMESVDNELAGYRKELDTLADALERVPDSPESWAAHNSFDEAIDVVRRIAAVAPQWARSGARLASERAQRAPLRLSDQPAGHRGSAHEDRRC